MERPLGELARPLGQGERLPNDRKGLMFTADTRIDEIDILGKEGVEPLLIAIRDPSDSDTIHVFPFKRGDFDQREGKYEARSGKTVFLTLRLMTTDENGEIKYTLLCTKVPKTKR